MLSDVQNSHLIGLHLAKVPQFLFSTSKRQDGRQLSIQTISRITSEKTGLSVGRERRLAGGECSDSNRLPDQKLPRVVKPVRRPTLPPLVSIQ